jgi:hypothetical protein
VLLRMRLENQGVRAGDRKEAGEEKKGSRRFFIPDSWLSAAFPPVQGIPSVPGATHCRGTGQHAHRTAGRDLLLSSFRPLVQQTVADRAEGDDVAYTFRLVENSGWSLRGIKWWPSMYGGAVALGDERVVVRVGLALVVPGGKHLADDDPVPGKDG